MCVAAAAAAEWHRDGVCVTSTAPPPAPRDVQARDYVKGTNDRLRSGSEPRTLQMVPEALGEVAKDRKARHKVQRPLHPINSCVNDSSIDPGATYSL